MENIIAKVLIVDDIEENLISLEAMLNFDDIEIHKANSGDAALKMLLKNKYALIISDVSMPGMDGFELLEFIRMDPNNATAPVILATAFNKEEKFVYKGYEEGAVDYLIKPLDNNVTRSKVRVFVDLHIQKMQLQLQKKNLEELVEQKNRFMGMMAHDIRGPLGILITYSDIIRSKTNMDEERLAKMTNIMFDTGNQLLTVLEDILDLSSLQSNNIELNLSQVNISDFVANNIEFNSIISQKKNIQIQFAPLLKPANIFIDESKITQVLNNLISNGIKYSKSNTQLFVSIEDSLTHITIHVRDEGQGIEESEIANLFNAYKITSTKSTSGEKSTGLGLFIVESIVNAHEGEVGVKSKIGRGSKFSFSISKNLTGKAFDNSLSNAKEIEKRPIEKVLIIDDDEITSTIIDTVMKKSGFETKLAHSGKDALNEYLAFSPDLIITDINLGDMSGIDVCKKIKEVNPFIPVFGITADSLAKDDPQYTEAGFNELFIKPFDRNKFNEIIQNYKA